MSILYKMRNLPKPNEEELMYLFPIPVSRGTKTLDDWAEEASMSGTLSAADVAAAMKSLEKFIIKSLRGGYKVSLNGIGSFSVVLSSRKVTDEKYIRANSIEVKDVNFHCSKTFVSEIKGATIEKAVLPKPTSFTFEERKQRLLNYMTTNSVITRSAYLALNGCDENIWRKDVSFYMVKKILMPQGKSPACYYILRSVYDANRSKRKGSR